MFKSILVCLVFSFTTAKASTEFDLMGNQQLSKSTGLVFNGVSSESLRHHLKVTKESLTSLSLHNCPLTQEDITVISKLPNLKSLYLSQISDVNDFSELGRLQKLEELHLIGLKHLSGNQLLSILHPLRHLESLEIKRCYAVMSTALLHLQGIYKKRFHMNHDSTLRWARGFGPYDNSSSEEIL